MRTWVPDLRLAVLLPPQAAVEDKFGGLPWELPPARWPVCTQCGQPQSLLAQLRHHPDRLNLGRDGRVLHVFQCADWANSGCDAVEWGRGHSACFVLEPEEIATGLTPLPGPIGRADDPWAWHGHVAARVLVWAEEDDLLPAEHHANYYDTRRWFYVPENQLDGVHGGIKLGGIPYWGNCGPADHMPAPWRMAVQIIDQFWFPGPMPDGLAQRVDESGHALTKNVWHNDNGDGWECQWANFATGVGHVYLDDADPRVGRFTWQRLI